MRAISLGLFFTISVVSAVVAGANEWTPQGPLGGDVPVLVTDPAGKAVYAGTTGGGVYKSTDGGMSWTPANAGMTTADVRALVVDPAAPTTLYAGVELDGIFKTTDGGDQWTRIDNAFPAPEVTVAALAIDPDAPSTLYAGTTNGGVFRSTDSALTWTAINQGLDALGVLSLAVDPAKPSTVYVGTSDGIRKSVDGGASWSATADSLSGTAVRQIVVDPAAPQTVYAVVVRGGFSGNDLLKSTDGGAGWTELDVGSNPFISTSFVQSLALDPGDSKTLYVATGLNSGVFRSTDGGATFSDASQGIAPTVVLSVVVDPSATHRVYAGTALDRGIYRSLDGAMTFAAANQGLTNTDILEIMIDPTAPTTVYAGFESGLFKSLDGGGTWNELDLGSVGFPEAVESLAIDPADPSIVYAGTSRSVFKTIDGGATWQQLGEIDTFSGSIEALVLDPQNPSTVYAGTADGLLKSTDGGATWAEVGSGLPTRIVFDLAIDPAQPSTLYATTVTFGGASRVAKSTDGGLTFTRTDAGLSGTLLFAISVDPLAPSTLYAAGFDGVSKTTDGGASWQPTGPLPDQLALAVEVDPRQPGTVYAATLRGVVKSTDGGATWDLVGGELPNFPFSLAIDPVDSSILYAGTEGGGAWKLEQVAGCVSDELTLCLDDEPGDARFAVSVTFDTTLGAGASGSARAVPLGELGVDRGGILWFFDPNNPEVLVKVLDGCGFNNRFWVFFAATTNVGFELTVTDTLTDVTRTYTNPDGVTAAPVTDTLAFATCSAKGRRDTREAGFRSQAEALDHLAALAGVRSSKGSTSACVAGATTLCLDDDAGDGRFRVTATFDTQLGAGASGDATAVSLVPLGIDRGGVLWFFDPTNPEVLVKVLDGCGINDRFWVFYAATTNAGFTLEVEDTRAGIRRVFSNPDGQSALPVADTSAFDTCDLQTLEGERTGVRGDSST